MDRIVGITLQQAVRFFLTEAKLVKAWENVPLIQSKFFNNSRCVRLFGCFDYLIVCLFVHIGCWLCISGRR